MSRLITEWPVSLPSTHPTVTVSSSGNSDLLITGRHASPLIYPDLPCYFMPFNQVFIIEIVQKWYHIKAEKIDYISYTTCVEEITMVFMLE